MSTWVHHISGQGERWKVYQDLSQAGFYRVYVPDHGEHKWDLPVSEYVHCAPPAVWVDVTDQVTLSDDCNDMRHDERWLGMAVKHGYRLRKVQLETPHKCGKTLASSVWAFIVERRTS